MVAALFVNNPAGGCVESVLTLDTHFFPVRLGVSLLCKVRRPRRQLIPMKSPRPLRLAFSLPSSNCTQRFPIVPDP
jgi:hypothetical protein